MVINKKIIGVYVSEGIGTALLLLIGLSAVIWINGDGLIRQMLPDAGLRRAVSGFLFGMVGCGITLSKVGKISGAHINPVVSMAFFLKKKLSLQHTAGFILFQMAGAVAGCVPLLLWHRQGASVGYGVTVPGKQGVAAAFLGEACTTFLLIAVILFFTGHRKLKHFTPYTMPFLYSFMVYMEAPVSGTSTNPARSFGPAVISHIWTHLWLYGAAPITGMLVAVLVFQLESYDMFKRRIAKLCYFNHNTIGLFTATKD